MHIGLDLDNTLICYDSVFYEAAVAQKLVDSDTPRTKNAVKAVVVRRHGNIVWTHLQGQVYGPLILRAGAYPGADDFIRRCHATGHTLCILSHKSQFSALDPLIDLRQAALRWLTQQNWLDTTQTGLSRQRIEFHDTRAQKVAAIARQRCDLFIDDLPEVLAEPGFPSQTSAFLFDPDDCHADLANHTRVGHWREITEAVLTGVTS